MHGLALLGELDRVDRRQLVDWIYALQVHPDARDRGARRRTHVEREGQRLTRRAIPSAGMNAADCGFRGGTFMGNAFGCPPVRTASALLQSR